MIDDLFMRSALSMTLHIKRMDLLLDPVKPAMS
ncbi:hypothetical protein Bache_2057 [Bacteroides helcogenes P 36-108]|uniref:Uncharacterized protein n=1 Tax=Bacteroides helcogenes (strain ATCC 35417 / DSM 20613 / JCM 6297 / CCUG 15421 / P 36-108) TaxID=693979 RepID=E6SQU5_BACT6|nr:hypothetical protein Bache_2057 [Bacteroides helcogenes P 36-108]